MKPRGLEIADPDRGAVTIPTQFLFQLCRDLEYQMILARVAGQLHRTGMLPLIKLHRYRRSRLAADIADIGKGSKRMTSFLSLIHI